MVEPSTEIYLAFESAVEYSTIVSAVILKSIKME
jgi:hypothetical protein